MLKKKKKTQIKSMPSSDSCNDIQTLQLRTMINPLFYPTAFPVKQKDGITSMQLSS
jgi:hypothetical protein